MVAAQREQGAKQGTTGLQCQRRGEGVDAMRDQSNAGPDPDMVFGARPNRRDGVACFTGTRVGVSQPLGYRRQKATR